MKLSLKTLPSARADIQDSIRWYNRQQKGLGRCFHVELKDQFEHLKINPFFQKLYSEVRCIPLKKFPFMVHYSVLEQENLVVIHAVFHTSLNPEKWKRKGT